MSDTKEQLKSNVDSVYDEVMLAVAGFEVPEDDTEAIDKWLEHYGIELDEGEDLAKAMREAHDEGLLEVSIDAVVWQVVHTLGGPHVEVSIRCRLDGNVIDGMVVGYWGGDKVERHLSTEDAEAYADHCIPERDLEAKADRRY